MAKKIKAISRATAIKWITEAIDLHTKFSNSYFWEGGSRWRQSKLQEEAAAENCSFYVRVYKVEAPIKFVFKGWCNPSRAHVYYNANWEINDKIVTMRQAKTLLNTPATPEAGTPQKKNKPTKGW